MSSIVYDYFIKQICDILPISNKKITTINTSDEMSALRRLNKTYLFYLYLSLKTIQNLA